jgi:macrolide-specific efflux system membrane fusion protein
MRLLLDVVLRQSLAIMLTGSATLAVEPEGTLTLADAQVTLVSEVLVPARAAGALGDITVKEGTRVEPGQVIGRLDADLAALDSKLAEIELTIAKLHSENDVDRRYAEKSLAVAQAEQKRALSAVKVAPGSITATELDRLQLLVDKTRLSIEQSDRDLQDAVLTEQLKTQFVLRATKQLQLREVVAPIRGMVVEVFRKTGEWVDPGDPVVRIVGMDRLRVEAFVDGARFGADLIDCPVRLEVKLPPVDRVADFHGHIVYVSPEVHPVNGQVRIWAEVDNPRLELRPGTRGLLTVDIRKPESVENDAKKTASAK